MADLDHRSVLISRIRQGLGVTGEQAARESIRRIEMQVALQHAHFPVLLVIAGEEASGKGEVVNILNAWLDPRGVETFAFHEPTDETIDAELEAVRAGTDPPSTTVH